MYIVDTEDRSQKKHDLAIYPKCQTSSGQRGPQAAAVKNYLHSGSRLKDISVIPATKNILYLKGNDHKKA